MKKKIQISIYFKRKKRNNLKNEGGDTVILVTTPLCKKNVKKNKK